MPPRRSSRAASASLEVPPAEYALTKRKRGQTAEPDTDEKENVAKPLSRTRRSSSVRSSAAPPSKSRKSTRAKTSLPDVPESTTKNNPMHPRRRKQGHPWRRSRRGASVAKSTPGPAKMEVDEEPASKPVRRASSRKATVSSGSRVSVGSAKFGETSGSARTDGQIEEEEEEEDIKPVKGRRGTEKAPSKAIQSDDDDEAMVAPSEEDDYEEDTKPARKGRKPKAPAARKGKPTSKTALKATVVEESDDDLEAPPSAQPRPAAKPVDVPASQAAAPEPEGEEEEEEKSLFDPPPMPAPSSLPQTIPEEPIGPKARLVIHKMALVNFKSYAGRQEIGPFHKSFSSIVGPNGSGKSNTIDALLFVFGYRASKMRQGKISELIHNSANHPDLEECSVEVHFRDIIDLPGPDAFTVAPGSQLIVTRTAYKNNASKYTINGRNSSYSEVQTLLKGRGIDLDHNRFLILQGEVESIAQMKPKAPSEHEDGLLEYLEDIIGTSKYKTPIDDAMVEMERLQEERQIKMNRLRHVEKEKLALEEKKKEAEDFLRLKNEHVRAISRHYQWVIWKALEKETKLEVQIEKTQKDLAEETEKHRTDIEHLEQLRVHYEDREKTYTVLQASAVHVAKELAATERSEIAVQERRKHAATRQKKLKKSIQEDTTARKNALNIIEDSSAKEEEKVLEAIRDSLKDKTQVFNLQIEEKQKELQPWTAQINTKQREIDVASSERDTLAKKAELLKTQCQEAEATLQALQAELQEKVDCQNSLKTEKSQARRDIQAADKRVRDAEGRFQEWRGKASSARQRVDEAKANQSENRSRNNVLESLTRLKDAGNNEGFHGRLGNLGTIPDKYDVAISTAGGGGLNNMVVERVTQAQSCIEYLRRNNVGRASFMVLEKLNPHGMDKIATPENAPRLFDLIKPKHEMYLPAFFKAVGNTLVANDMEQANRIAFGGSKRWRVVTLDGGLIETSGAMSGGGSQPSRGAMSSKFSAASVSPQTLQSYERDSEQAAQQLHQATEELKHAEQELERLKARDPEIDLSYQKLGMDIENVKRRISEADRRVKDLSSQNKPNTGDLARISKLESEIIAAEKGLGKLKERTAKIEQEIKDLEKKILEIGGSKFLSQKSKVEGIRLHIKLTNDEITKAEVAKSKAEKDSVKFETSVNNNTTTLEEVEAELQELEEELANVSAHVTELKEKLETAQAAAENSKEDLENLKAELDQKEESVAEFRSKELKLKQKLGDFEKEYKTNSAAIEQFNEQHDALTLIEIDEDDEGEEDEEEGAQNDESTGGIPAVGENPPEEPTEGEVEVKPEPGSKPQKKPKRERTPSHELHVYSEEELRRFTKDELLADVVFLEERISRAKPDMTVLKEYKQREAEFMNRAKDLENITTERDAQKAQYDGLRKQRLDEFMAGFNLITLKLKEMYQMITLGGNAELELVDSMDPFSEGIIFSVMPPKKSWKNISNLSGGEKTLSSLALVFALHVFKPTPLYFMDEIDAALDFRNVSIVANYIKDRTKNAQFIIISLRNDMFELSHRLIGIYKTSNATRSIAIDNHSLHSSIPVAHVPNTKATA
ncbi:unnamed protein product [Cyclocybe aegerita]|uniref:Structural maintenance of chromosomes protein 4 n=1 Tax=Cyclocybe aegerita TaxID=1973307 RepID=A0A8S0WCE6_CYCAE|nr:unnamed protein product [Cyclocybe aegerita]